MVLRCKRICRTKQTRSKILIGFNIINLNSLTEILVMASLILKSLTKIIDVFYN